MVSERATGSSGESCRSTSCRDAVRAALGRFLGDGAVSVDNKHIENLMRPWAMGRKAWLFAGSESAGKRAAVVMSLVQSARLHGHDPWVYLRDVLERLLSHPNHRIDELLPHRWSPSN